MSIKDKKRGLIIGIIVGVILFVGIVFFSWFSNRKFDVSFDFDNGTKTETVLVKYNKTINKKDIKDKSDLGETFVNWYEIVDVKDGNDVLSDKPFDFNTKISKDIKLKAVYESNVETFTVKFDSKGGNKIDDVILNKGEKLKLPKNPVRSGYKFIVWEDKNETPIYEDALLDGDITLYAKWKKITTQNNTKPNSNKVEPEKPNTDKPNTEKPNTEKPTEIVYYCDNGYTLEGTKCIKTLTETASIVTSCKSPYNLKVDNKCININEKTDLVKTCKKYNNYDGMVAQGVPLCFYNPLSDAPDYNTCRSRYHYNSNVGFYNGKCYENKFGSDYITYACPSGYSEFYPSATSNPVCGKSIDVEKSYVCDSGYERKGKNCVKTIVIDAKQK